MEDGNTKIIVDHVTKNFRVYRDKSHTFKDRVIFRKRNAYETRKVLDDISFTVDRGEAVGLIGHNGCGKSTTLKLLNKILYPDEGTITMRGKISSLIELGAGFHPDMSGRENIYINASIFGLKKKEIDDRLQDIIRFSELEEFIDNPVRTYSSGMYMRLAFSIAINVNADILLIDEILAVGDANFQTKCFNRLREIKAQGTTVVIVSHSMNQIQSFCDRAIWLDGGKIRESGKPVEVCEDYLIDMGDKAIARRREEREKLNGDVEIDPNKLYPPDDVSDQVSSGARRSGHMNARFLHITMADGENVKKQDFSYREAMHLAFEYQNDTGAEIGVIFNIVKRGGLVCTTLNSRTVNRMYPGGKGSGTLSIDALPLTDGRYYLDAMIENKGGVMEDFMNHVIEFTVATKEEHGTGVVAVDAGWA